MINLFRRVRYYPLTVAVGATLALSPAAIVGSTAVDNSLNSELPWRHFPGTLAVGMAVFVLTLTLATGHSRQPAARPWSIFFATWAAVAGLNCILTIGSGNAITPSAIAGILMPAAFVRYQPLDRDTRAAKCLFPAAFVFLSVLFSAADWLGLVRDQTWTASRITQALPWVTDPLLLARWSMPWADANLAGTLALCAVIVGWNTYRNWMRVIVPGAAGGLLVLSQSRYALLVGLGVLCFSLIAPRVPSDKPLVRTLLAPCIAVGVAVGALIIDPSINGRVNFFWSSLKLLKETGPLGVCFRNDCVISPSTHFSHSSMLEPVVQFGVLLLVPLLVCLAALFALIRVARFKPAWTLLAIGALGGYWILNFHVGISYWTVVSAIFVMSLASLGVTRSPNSEGPTMKDLLRPDGVQQQ